MFRIVVRKKDQVLREAIFDAEIVSIGRHKANDIRIGSSERPHTISRFHAAVIENESGDHFARDLGSKNGISLNGERIFRKILKDGDLIEIMEFSLEFEEIKPEEVILRPEKTRHRAQKSINTIGTTHDTETERGDVNIQPGPFFPEPGDLDVFLTHLLHGLCRVASADLVFCAQVIGDGFFLPRHAIGIVGHEIPAPSEKLFSQVVTRKTLAMDWALREGKLQTNILAIGLPLQIGDKLHLIYLEARTDRCEMKTDKLSLELLRILDVAQNLLSEEHPPRAPNDPGQFKWKENLVGNARLASMVEVKERLKATSQNRLNTLLYGETGTGKEIAASKIHELSGREGKFIAINCKEVPTNLLSDRLFGHGKGAFSEAKGDKPGAFEEAHKGTLFLDEIGCLDLERQEILLRPLREKKIVRLGETKERKLDVKILFATNEALEEKARKGLMRHDFLYGRVLEENPPIELPPLRDRKEDIPLLANFFIDEAMDPKILGVDHGVVQDLRELKYDWPANVQELKSVVMKAIGSAHGEARQIILQKDIEAFVPNEPEGSTKGTSGCGSLSKLKKAECETILHVLRATGGNVTKAAKKLGLSRPTLYKKCEDYGIDPKAFKAKAE